MKNQSSYISNFKYYLKYCVTIILIFIISALTADLFFEKYIIFSSNTSGAYKLNRIINETHNEEIPIFGSSRAQGSYIPNILGNHYFNYGIDGIGANIWMFFLEQELEKKKSSKIILNFDLNGFFNSYGDLSSYIPNYKFSKNLILKENSLKFNIPGIRYFGFYEFYLKSYINVRTNFTKLNQNGGSFEKNILEPKTFENLIKKRNLNPEKFIQSENLAKKMMKLISSTERKIFIIVAPYHYSYLKNFKNIEIANNYLNELNKANNVEVIDLRNCLSNDNMFFNTTHLNYEGAKSFSTIVKSSIKDLN